MHQWVADHIVVVIIVAAILAAIPAVYFSARAEQRKADADYEYQQWKKQHGLE